MQADEKKSRSVDRVLFNKMKPGEGSRLSGTQIGSILRNQNRVKIAMFSTLGIGGVMYLMYMVEPFSSMTEPYKYRGPKAPTVPTSGTEGATYSVRPTPETESPHTGIVRGQVEGRGKS